MSNRTVDIYPVSGVFQSSGNDDGEREKDAYAVVMSDGSSNVIAYCRTAEDAERIKTVIQLTNQDANGITVHVHIDGQDLAKAMMPHLATAVRNATGTRNF